MSPQPLSDAEQRQLIEWNDTRTDDPTDRLISDLFVEHASKNPTAIAAVFGDTQLLYRELDARSNQLAHHLRGLGVGPEVNVGLCVERSLDLVVAVLGILKAGGACVPLEATYPAERLKLIVEDSKVPIVIAHAVHREVMTLCNARCVFVDAEWPNAESTVPVSVALDPACTAYVIYTSGSTGQPKGVMVTHGAIVNAVRWRQQRFPLGRDDAVLHKTALSFDPAIWEIWGPLSAGARLVIARPGGHREPAYLVDAIQRHRITTIDLVPSQLRALLDEPSFARSGLKRVFCGGEAMTEELLLRFADTMSCELVNMYGPTETTIDATSWVCRAEERRAHPPIGRPIANVRAYILDEQLQPVPPGVPGEVYLGGSGLARGYLGRPGLSAERFLCDPFDTVAGARMYRTGDLARHVRDGNLEFLGRTDIQIKLRGFRVEPGEIEAALANHASVREAAVVVHEATPGDQVLVGYVVFERATPESVVELRQSIEQVLPEHMVPYLVSLEDLPRTAGGKIDRKALRQRPISIEPSLQQPLDETQTRVAAVFERLLKIEGVGRDGHFFGLGGHSLLATRLLSAIARELGVEITLRQIFDNPTVEEIARLIDAAKAPATNDDAAVEREVAELVAAMTDANVTAQLTEWSQVKLELQPSPNNRLAGARRELFDRLMAQHRIDSRTSQPLARRDSTTAPTTFSQRMLWGFHEAQRYDLGNTAAYSLTGHVDHQAMQQAIAALVRRHDALRTVFHMVENRLVQEVCGQGPVLEIVDLSAFGSEDRQREAMQLFETMSRPHDLARETFRATLVRFDDREHVLVLSKHHIVVDGFSTDLLLTDLAALYRAIAAGTQPDLAPIAFEFRDFCFWQRTLEQRPIGKKQLQFWARAVAGYRVLELPGDRPVTVRDMYVEATVPFALEGAAWKAVEPLCSRWGCTPFAVIATGFFLLLTRWSGQTDACVLSSSLHRDRPGSEAVIGNFVAPYPLRMVCDDSATLEETVRRCQEMIIVNRENSQVAPSSALETFPDWSRYILNYMVALNDSDDGLDFGTATMQALQWAAAERQTYQDLALIVGQSRRGVHGNLHYIAERLSPELATRAATRLREILHAITTDSSTRVGELPRVT